MTTASVILGDQPRILQGTAQGQAFGLMSTT
jgi:hypothetical protein